MDKLIGWQKALETLPMEVGDVATPQNDDEITRLHAELAEQCRLHGIGSEREARLMAERDEARREMERCRVDAELAALACDVIGSNRLAAGTYSDAARECATAIRALIPKGTT